MKRGQLLLLPLMLFVHLAVAGQEVTAVVSAVNDQTLMPQFGPQLTIENAYQIQTAAVKALLAGKTPDGFKAGLTSRPGQKKFAVTEAVAGVLPAASRLLEGRDGYVIEIGRYNKLMLELEIGFQISGRISRPITDVENLKQRVSAVYPLIELPDLGFQNMAVLLGSDIIANNVAARHYILGPAVVPGKIDLNSLSVQLFFDDELLVQGIGSDAMGDQWQALLWLINQSLANGWQIEPGQILITGALGRMVPAQNGQYTARFSGLGSIGLRVQ